MEIKNVVLASASPRRNELLCDRDPAGDRGEPRGGTGHFQRAVGGGHELASQKAADVAAGRKAGETVIGSDTVVAIDGKILGKPKTHEEAVR